MVVAAAYDFAVEDDDGPDRDFARRCGIGCQREGGAHEAFGGLIVSSLAAVR
jgi:hypothetical protein